MQTLAEHYDLHTHSVHSDGTTTVQEIAYGIHQAGLKGFALTDHDTCAGWGEARQAAAVYGLDFLPGVELTTKHGDIPVHLLGYGFNPENSELAAKLAGLRKARKNRIQKMVAKLAQDYPLSATNFTEIKGAIGRPHIADALIKLGVVKDREEAFNTLLSSRSKYYVPNEYLTTASAIKLVQRAGGVAVLAHPAASRNRKILDRQQLYTLTAAGLQGIELHHPENNLAYFAAISKAASGLELLVTGSSDYHGAGKPNFLGQCTTTAATVQKIRELAVMPR